MHDIDRALFEAEAENYGETYETFGEDREQEQVAGLLEVTTEEELDRFLGDLLIRFLPAQRAGGLCAVGRRDDPPQSAQVLRLLPPGRADARRPGAFRRGRTAPPALEPDKMPRSSPYSAAPVGRVIRRGPGRGSETVTVPCPARGRRGLLRQQSDVYTQR